MVQTSELSYQHIIKQLRKENETLKEELYHLRKLLVRKNKEEMDILTPLNSMLNGHFSHYLTI